MWPFKKKPEPTNEELLQAALDDAQRKLQDHLALGEYHNAMSTMLMGRVERLKEELK